MAQKRDAVLLMTGKTSLIEETQQRYIDALEKRISCLESRARNSKQPQDIADSTVDLEATSSSVVPDIEEPPNTSTHKSTATSDSKSDSRKESNEYANSKHLKDAVSVQAYSRFFGKVKIVARRYSKDNDGKNEKPVGEEEVISDVQSTVLADAAHRNKTTPEQEKQSQTTTAPITFTLGIDDDGCVFKANVKINDSELQAMVQIFFAQHPRFGLDLAVFSIDSPFEPFIQHWRDLQALAKCEEGHSAVLQFRKRLQRFKVLSPDLIGWPQRLLDLINSNDSIERMSTNLGTLLELIHEAVRGRAGERSLSRILEENLAVDQDVVSFDNLWTIYKPGDIVISHLFLGEPQAFIVHESMESGMQNTGITRYWGLICWSYDWTGKTFRRIQVELRVESFEGARKVQSLSVCPIKYLSEAEKDNMKQRGRNFWEICLRAKGSRLFQYSGDAILRASGIGKVSLTRALGNDEDPDKQLSPWHTLEKIFREVLHGPDFTNTTIVEIDGDEQVMIDTLSFRQHGPGKHYNQMPMGKVRFWNKVSDCRCSICQQNFALNENQKPHYDLEPGNFGEGFEDSTQYLICPPRVLGYHLSRKHWVELNVNDVKKVERKIDTSAFDQLQMESIKSKELLKKLVMSHWNRNKSDNKGKMQDLMKGKGESLVILLYGPPGVGKTLTAESVALATGKPLLFVSVADIGLQPEKVEENLVHAFRLAASWEAIILFDEADVFLESRSGDTASFVRNALVSELLRVLEYYDGMLILTTNRLRRFDHAVMSRINLAIRFPELSHEQKRTIFLNFIGQLDEDATADLARIEAWIKDDDTRELFDGLNGRQIRNILFSSAKMTSQQEGGKLNLEAIKQLAQATKRFAQEIRADMEASRVKNEPSYRAV